MKLSDSRSDDICLVIHSVLSLRHCLDWRIEMIYLYVFIFNLPRGESDKIYRHEFKELKECQISLSEMKRPDKNVLAYCATESERQYNGQWFKDKKRDLNKE